MATYNGAQFVAEQIDSILAQSYLNVGLIISDDGSSDGTVAILKTYESKSSNIKVFSNQERLGFVKNFESLLLQADGDYFTFADQDDIWDVQKIERMMNAMLLKEKIFPNTPVMVHSDLRMINEQGELLHPSYARYRNYRFSKSKDVAAMISRGGVMGNTMLFNKKLRALVLPFHENIVHHDYWIALINEIFGHRVSLKEPLVSYRIHAQNTSQKIHLFQKQKHNQQRNRLPYQDNNRYEVLKGVLNRYVISEEDKRPIIIFLQYLRAQKGWLKLYPRMVREGFFKQSIHKHSTYLGRFTLASIRVRKSTFVKSEQC